MISGCVNCVSVQQALAPRQTKGAVATQLFILGDTSYGADHCDEVNAEVSHSYGVSVSPPSRLQCTTHAHSHSYTAQPQTRSYTTPIMHVQHVGADFLVHYGAATFR